MRVFTFLAVFLGGLFVQSLSDAHSWYPLLCCSDKDCHELVEERGETVTEGPAEFMLWDGQLIRKDTARTLAGHQVSPLRTQRQDNPVFFRSPGRHLIKQPAHGRTCL